MTTKEFVTKIEKSALSYPKLTFSVPGKAYTCVNPYSYHIFKRNSELYSLLDGLYVDGMSMCWWIRLLWGKKIPRLSFDMSGMAADLFEILNSRDDDRKIYFIGARQEEIIESVNMIQKAYPGIKIAGFRNGYFKDENDRNQAILKIIDHHPDFVVVGMGSPLQERFVIDLKSAGYKGISFTCGGFLHQTCRRINYYPGWVDKMNLRAFYRLIHEKGMFSRLWNILVKFPVDFTKDSLQSFSRDE